MQKVYGDIYDNRHGYPGMFSLYRCNSCGFWRTCPPLDRKDLAEVYQRYYPRSTETSGQVLSIFERLKKMSALDLWINGSGISCYRYIAPGSSVLDIGCGNCLSLLMARHLGARRVIGIDVDANVPVIASELALDVFMGQLSDLPAEKGTFDYIIAEQVIEHEPDPVKFLLEMKERLNPDGRIILSLPNVGAFYRQVFGKRWLHWHPPYHINHFSRKSLIMMAGQCGFIPEKIRTVTPNDWMLYQMRTMRAHLSPGQRDPFWDPGGPHDPPAMTKQRIVLRKIKNALVFLGVRPVICLANRLLDTAGLGESFVVTLSPG
jgi:2-polyprenyl-3-methyl-5-hydroxy-6-metoxy-1,4-benzoquinol methylase